ncbi:LacI family DNA-binding transcriptional regulator [Sulfitobacter geojensis]|uniref:LacI family DNA-binding transcriptional regulator n=1 Tax=Sulfitobacter geojensis TaxID=1342299 RepID=UPI00046AEA9E|nr:LacI family DNA-binding transcriptional regulator [Sulfitobacter geojensis]KHA52917.1 Maltose operon transcriptional repressor MalR, LacI family [Sulfitobacter geojensis]NYI28426.1 DNA-binding LacI/PurR family transcriptional regulator [Sulfitobacter geojensis]
MVPVKIRNMEEFASISGLSRPTVSKYFHDPGSVRATTRARIEAALEKYDYRPNIFAMNQNRKLTKNVGIMVPYLADPFFAEIARNIEQRCIDAGYSPTLFSSHGNPDLEVEILENLRALKPAGALIAPLGRISDSAAVSSFCDEVPTVLFDSNLPDMGLAFIGSDNPQFSMLMVEYLCRTGEPPCFFEMKDPANPNANKRRQGYLDAMTQLGFEPSIVKVEGQGWSFEEIGRAGGIRTLEAGGFATNTILCSNDRLAIGLLTACYEKGLRVGRDAGSDLRIAGQDDHPFSRFTCPPLTTIAQDYDAVSRRAVQTLFDVVESGDQSRARETVLYEGKLIMRQSA